MRNNRIIPYILIISGGLLLISGLGILIRQNTRKATIVDVPAQTNPDGTLQSAVAPSQEVDTNWAKGYDFEKWVVDHTNPQYWELKEWQGDKYHKGRYPSSNRNPDLLFDVKVKGTQKSVALECKWKNDYLNDRLDWAGEKQIAIYNSFEQDKGAKVFVVIGVGGNPGAPKDVYTVPLSALKFPSVAKDYLAKYRANNVAGKFYFDFESDKLFLGR